MDHPRNHHHSLFWPIILVGIGVIWLLVNLGVIAPISIGTVLQFWPILLIVLGLDILFGRQYAWVGGLAGILVVAGLVAYLVMAPASTTNTASQVLTENFSAPVSEAVSVSYRLETASEPVDIHSLASGSDQLIDANLTHQGQINFSVNGTSNKTVSLSEITNPSDWFAWNLFNSNMKWDIGLAAGIPADISLSGGSGSIHADLTGVKLQSLNADLGSGASDFSLPQSNQDMAFDLNSGSGSVNMSLPSSTNVTLKIQSGSGALNVALPANAAVRIEVMNGGSGSLNLPGTLIPTSGNSDSGTWQSAGYDQATERILIQILDRGSGSISIH